MGVSWVSPSQRRYSPEFKQRAVRMVRQLRAETGQKHSTLQRAANQLGCWVESLRVWVSQEWSTTVNSPAPPARTASGSRSSSRATPGASKRRSRRRAWRWLPPSDHSPTTESVAADAGPEGDHRGRHCTTWRALIEWIPVPSDHHAGLYSATHPNQYRDPEDVGPKTFRFKI